MSRSPCASRRRGRRGTVVVAALALVALAAGLLVSAAVVASASAGSALRARAAVAAESGARRSLARAMMNWSTEVALLDVGQSRERAVVPIADDFSAELPVQLRLRVQRLGPALYLLAVDVRIGGAASGARRRVALLVRCPVAGSVIESPHAIAQWSAADLY